MLMQALFLRQTSPFFLLAPIGAIDLGACVRSRCGVSRGAREGRLPMSERGHGSSQARSKFWGADDSVTLTKMDIGLLRPERKQKFSTWAGNTDSGIWCRPDGR